MHARPSRGTLIAGVIAVLTVAGCASNGGTTTIGSPPYEEGSGGVKTESRTVEPFHSVAVSQGVNAILSSDTTPSVAVTADANLLGHITTVVRDGVLVIGVTGSIRTDHPLDVAIRASGIDAISASAGATLKTEELAATALHVSVDSGATLRAQGKVETLDLAVDAGASADLRNIKTSYATVRVSTGSTAFINAKETVTGTCGTGSTLHVSGNPDKLDVAADTSSTVKRD